VVDVFCGGLDGFFRQGFFLEPLVLDCFGAPLVEMVGPDDDGPVVFPLDGNLAFLRFVAGSLAVD